MTAAALRRKLASIGKRVPIAGVPHVLEVQLDETREAAFARFAAEHPIQHRGHCALLVVPAPINSAEELAAFKVAFEANQVALVHEARSNRKPVANSDPVSSATTNPIPIGAKVLPPRFKMQRPWRKQICPAV